MARSFNGTTDVITTVASSLLTPASGSMTMAGWIKPSAGNNYGGSFGSYIGASNGGVGIFVESDGKLSVYTSGGAQIYDPGSHTLSNNIWYHIAVTFLFSGGNASGVGYVNGASDGSGGPVTSDVSSAKTFKIGSSSGGGAPFFGSVADVGVWNVALSVSELLSLASGVRPYNIRQESLQGYWPLDGLQSPEPDLSGNVFNGTLTGSAFASGPPIKLFIPRHLTQIIVSTQTFSYSRPDADSIDGAWTNELNSQIDLFASIDETAFDDADYIISSNNPSADLCKISLSDPAGTLSEPATVRYRYAKRGEASFQIDLQVTLLQGVTTIAQWTHTDIGTSFVTAQQTLTTLQFNAISDFTDLFLQFNATKV